MKKQKLHFAFVALFGLTLMGFGLQRCDDPEALCNAAAEISAESEIRCGSSRTREEAIQAFKNLVAFGDCKTVKSIRDASALYDQCLPWLETASCELILRGQVLPACKNQFSTVGK